MSNLGCPFILFLFLSFVYGCFALTESFLNSTKNERSSSALHIVQKGGSIEKKRVDYLKRENANIISISKKIIDDSQSHKTVFVLDPLLQLRANSFL